MKKHYVVKDKRSSIYYYGTILKVKAFAKNRESDFRELTDSEKSIVLSEGILHLGNINFLNAEIEGVGKDELVGDEIVIPVVDKKDNEGDEKNEGKENENVNKVKEGDEGKDKVITPTPKPGKKPAAKKEEEK